MSLLRDIASPSWRWPLTIGSRRREQVPRVQLRSSDLTSTTRDGGWSEAPPCIDFCGADSLGSQHVSDRSSLRSGGGYDAVSGAMTRIARGGPTRAEGAWERSSTR